MGESEDFVQKDPTLAAPVRWPRVGTQTGRAVHRADGSILLTCVEPLAPYPESWVFRLCEWAERAPERLFLTEPDDKGGRRSLTYGQAVDAARRIAQALRQRGLGAAQPVAILAENSIDNALMTLGALFGAIPVAPISPSYALMARDFNKLRDVFGALGPGLVFIADGVRYGDAVRATAPRAVEIISAGRPVEGRATTAFDRLRDTPRGEFDAAPTLCGETVAKILFTSGSSGPPKAVILTHRMLAANRQQNLQAFAFLEDEPPVMVDWLPWHHTFGGNNNFGFALWCGGTFHIDTGKPTPEGIKATAALLEATPPTIYYNTPAGFDALLPLLKRNESLRARFFSRLNLIQYGAAVLPSHIWRALDELAIAACGARILIVSGLGSTECGPTPLVSTWDQKRQPEAGLPLPGVEAKLVPIDGKYELRLRGPCVTSGYWNRPDLTAAAFDEEGYFKMGDAVRPVDPKNFARGLVFDGRLSENFKLATGTWVQAADLRGQLVNAMAPLLKDAVIAGHDRAFVSAIGFPDLEACRELAALAPTASDEEVLRAPRVRSFFSERLSGLAAGGKGSAMRILRLIVELESPSFDNGELTDKATANARAVLARRADVVSELYRPKPSPRTILAN